MDTSDLPDALRGFQFPVLRPANRTLPSPVRPPSNASSFSNFWIIVRGISRHWWQILLIWAVGSMGLAALVFSLIKPIYEADSLLRVEPSSQDLFSASPFTSDFENYLETQVQLIKSPHVLLEAAASSEVAALPTIRAEKDAETALRERLKVSILPKSYLIRISATTTSAVDSASIVNVVTKAYLGATDDWADRVTDTQIKKLEKYERELETQAKEQREAWLALVAKGNISTSIAPQGSQAVDNAPRSAVSGPITVDEFQRARADLFQVSVELIEAESLLEMRRQEAAGADPGGVEADQAARGEGQVEEAFRNDPEVIALVQQMGQARAKVAEMRRRVRQPGDPAVTSALARVDTLKAEYQRLWGIKRPQIQARMTDAEKGTGGGDKALREAAMRVEALRASKAERERMLRQAEVSNREQGTDTVKASFIQASLEQLRGMQAAVTRRLEQLKFEARGSARILQISPARPASRPVSDKRSIYTAVASVGMLGAVLGLFTLVEGMAGRVADTDQLSARMRLEVYTVPPLPLGRPSRGLPDRTREEFAHRLDHLRVALCDSVVAGRGRCIMITSAIGGEGKTTLAAQLAARCAESGASTLLIDADLRRATLGRLLEVPDGPGLSDVLRGEVEVDEALVAVTRAGGCHLLPAGTPEDDPSRVLKEDLFGPVLEQLRQRFDIIIVDTPPVLAVPDALVLGRRVDGAVLATRYDNSRYSLVERANDQLISARINVLGVVLSGMRPSGSSYQSYAYNYQSTR